MRSPDGKVVKKVGGPQLAEALAAQGWTPAEAPPPEPRKRETKRKGYYYSDSAFRGY